jgi:hypothetical protein
MVMYSVALDYEEDGAKLNMLASTATADGPSPVPSSSPSTSVLDKKTPLLAELAELVHVPVDGCEPLLALQAIRRGIRQRLLPALVSRDAQEAVDASKSSTTATVGCGYGCPAPQFVLFNIVLDVAGGDEKGLAKQLLRLM